MSDLAARIAAVPYYVYLGLRPGPDESILMPAGDRHASDRPVIHGGVLTALLEAAAVLHLGAVEGPAARTADLTVTFLRPANLVETIARARTVRRGRRFAQVEITAWQADPTTPAAIGSGTWLL